MTGLEREKQTLARALAANRIVTPGDAVATRQPERTNQNLAWRRVLQIGLMALATCLGFWGFQEKAGDARWQWHTIWESAFRTLQLLTTQFPRELGEQDIPVQLQIARFAMPLFAAWFSLGALLRRLNRPIAAFTAGRAHDHVVLIGESDVAVALARAFRRLGRPVVAIVARPPTEAGTTRMEQASARVVFGDFRSDTVLRRAAVARAAILIQPEDTGTDAVLLAIAAARLCRSARPRASDPLVLVMRLGHRELRALVRNQIAASLRALGSPVTLRLYVREQTLARSLLSRFPADWAQPPDAHDLHVAIVGLGYMGGELLLQLARTAVPLPPRRAVVTVLDRNANGLRDQLFADYPGLPQCLDLRFVQAEISASAISAEQIEAWFGGPTAASAIYVCCGDDSLNLSIALGVRRACSRHKTPAPAIFVYQGESHSLVEGLAELHEPNFDTTRIVPFGAVSEEADPFFLVDEEIDVLARAVHEQYLASRTPDAKPLPAAVPWQHLEETYRAASRSQADHLPAKLRTLRWHAKLEAVPSPMPAIDPSLLETMAAQEHDRWCRELWLAGWRYGADRNDAERTHSALADYEKLADGVKKFDRDAIAGLPSMLARLGFSTCADIRVGVWACGAGNALPPQLQDRLQERVSALAAAEHRHLVLVLPLRNVAERTLVAHIAQAGPLSLEVAMPVKPGRAVPTLDGCTADDVRSLTRSADRAYLLQLKAATAASTSDAASVLRLAGLCDKVLLVSESAEDAEPLRDELPADVRHKIEIVAS